MIRAIETVYKGYRFRSRLEARWAVFFDALGVEWEYEKEGFDLGEDGWYLPDFWLPGWGCWAEIKSSNPERGYLLKPTAFAWNDGGQPLLLILGNPWPGEYLIDFLQPGYHRFTYEQFAPCRRCDGICLLSDNPERTQWAGWTELGRHTCGDHDKWPVGDGFADAYKAARSARFEHGETPKTPSAPVHQPLDRWENYYIGCIVRHEHYGEGVIIKLAVSCNEPRASIRFKKDNVAQRQFLLNRVKLEILYHD